MKTRKLSKYDSWPNGSALFSLRQWGSNEMNYTFDQSKYKNFICNEKKVLFLFEFGVDKEFDY